MQAAKLPHDASNKKAQELQLSDFGPSDEVLEQAKPLRFAANRREASEILKMIAR
ncbi:MAG: hypothetical protein LBT16_11760 [Treponema sp.]|nr:hypothetical protein [Treponema sp.]